MNLVTFVFRLPFLPVRGLIRMAEIIRDQADEEYHSSAAARGELEEAEQAAEAGEISDEEVWRREYEAISRLAAPRPPASRRVARGKEG